MPGQHPLRKHELKKISLEFEKGELKAVNDKKFDHPVRAIQYLQSIAQPYAIGRDIHVGDTIIGIKGRVGFEAAAPTDHHQSPSPAGKTHTNQMAVVLERPAEQLVWELAA